MDAAESQLLRELQKENIWWQTSIVPTSLAKDFHRSDYYNCEKFLENNKVNVIIGPRRVGKSTVIYQLIEHLIKVKKISPQRIIYLSLERPFFSFTKDPIADSIKAFEENILRESISDLKNPIYLFLDEASRHAGWAALLKQYIDRKYRIIFFISGSSSPALYQKSSESLVGRKNDILMLPLKYADAVRFQNPQLEINIQILSLDLRASLQGALNANDPKKFFEKLSEVYASIKPQTETHLKIFLNDYFLRGGYPEFYDTQLDWDETSRTMREAYFNSIITYDMVNVFQIRNPENIRKLYIFLALGTANIINLNNLATDIGISKNSLNDYFIWLQETHLISVTSVYRKNKRKVKKDIKKAFVTDVGMRNAVLGLSSGEIQDSGRIGAIAETVVSDHLHRLKVYLEPSADNDIFFWKNIVDRELDFVIELAKMPIPFEVKYQTSIKSEDTKVIRDFITEFKSPFGFLITKNSLQLNDKIISLPLWLFLIIC